MKCGVPVALVPDVVERQRAVPLERLPDPFHDLANLGADDADLEHVAAAGPLDDLPINMTGDETSAVEHRLRALERPSYRGLDQQTIGERIVLFELLQQRIAPACVADPPDAGTRGAEGGLDEKRIGPLGREFVRRANDIGLGLRHFQPRQQVGETGLALDLFERLEIGERYSKAGGKLFARGGEQVGLLMHRKQRVDSARFDGFDARPRDIRPDRRPTQAPDGRDGQNARNVQGTSDRWRPVRPGGRRAPVP